MYLARMSRPDFRTIARFRRLHEQAIAGLFAQTVVMASRMGLVLLEHAAVDGTKLHAQASRRRYRKAEELDEVLAKTDERINQILKEMEEADAREDVEHRGGPADGVPEELRKLKDRKKRYEEAKAELQRQGAKAVVTTEPESRLMQTREGLRPSYNAQAVVDSGAQVIVAADVTQDVCDVRQLGPMLEQARSTAGRLPDQVTADGGYWSKDNLDYAQQQNLDAYIAPAGAQEDGMVGWVYDKERDLLLSPAGEEYPYSTMRKNHGRTYRGYRCKKTQHIKWINGDADQILRMRGKVTTAEGKAIYNRRKTVVEPVFGHIKGPYGLRKLLLRGLSGARIEYMLACITHNLGKIANAQTVNMTLGAV
jgi:hypothetical protein